MRITVSCLLAALAAAAPAQTTRLVGPAGLAQIRDALAISSPGDVIQVQPGTYAQFTASVGVTIRALMPGTVNIQYDANFAPPGCLGTSFYAIFQGPTFVSPPAGQAVHLVGLRFLPNVIVTTGMPIAVRHRVSVSSGIATFDQCDLSATDIFALSVQDAAVHLQGCTLAAIGSNLKGHAMTATNAKVTATGCSFTGNSTTGVYDQPGNGIRLSSTALQGSNLTVQGGSLLAGSTGAAALSADGSCRVWISDSTLTGGGSTCAVSPGGAAGRIDRSTLSPAGPTCSSLPPGLVLGIERPQPLQNGAVFTLNHRTDPNAWVAVFVSPGLGDASAPGLLEQPVSLSPSSFWNAGLFVADPTGFVAAAWNIPAGPAFVDLQLWFQGVSGTTLPLQVSPVAGGIVR